MRELQSAFNPFFAVLGPRWRGLAPRALRYSRRQIERIASGTARVSPAMHQRLERLAVTTARPEAIEAWARAEHEAIDAMRAEWTGAATNLRTQLKLMAIEEQRHPPRNGRPRKRVPGPAHLTPARVRALPAPDATPEAYPLPRAAAARR